MTRISFELFPTQTETGTESDIGNSKADLPERLLDYKTKDNERNVTSRVDLASATC
jgi:hypothetical protein